MNTAYTVESSTLIVDQTHPVLDSGKPNKKKYLLCAFRTNESFGEAGHISVDLASLMINNY